MRKYGKEIPETYGGFGYQNADDVPSAQQQSSQPQKSSGFKLPGLGFSVKSDKKKKSKSPAESGPLFGKSSSGVYYGNTETTPLAKQISSGGYSAPFSTQGVGSSSTGISSSSVSAGGLSSGAQTYGSDMSAAMSKQSGSETSHIGSIKPNYYHTARNNQAQNAAENEPWFFNVVTEMLKFIYEKLNFQELAHFMTDKKQPVQMNQVYSSPKLVLTQETEEKLQQFQKFVTLPYDTEKEMHERLLYQLFCLCFDFDAVTTVAGEAEKRPNVSFKKWKKLYRHSDLWKHVGFQQKKPESDFRGCGVFGLKNLVYFGKNHPHRFQKQLESSLYAVSWSEEGELVEKENAQSPPNKAIPYPFVIASLNVTMMLFDILGCGMNASKCSNMTARKRMIDLICRGNYDSRIAEEEDDEKDKSALDTPTKGADDDRTPTEQKHGVILDFGEDVGQVPKTPETEAEIEEKKKKEEEEKKKLKKRKTKSSKLVKEKNNYVFEELYVASFKLLDKYWYKAGRNRDETKIFAFNTVLEETRSEVEELLEDTFLSVDDIIVYNKTEHGDE